MSVFIATVPFSSEVTSVKNNVSSSKSVSFSTTFLVVTSESSSTVNKSFTAIGASFTEVTVTESVPVVLVVPSDTVYVIVSVPLKSAAGV